jgi:ABC-type uncharacterized transport system permease subunit
LSLVLGAFVACVYFSFGIFLYRKLLGDKIILGISSALIAIGSFYFNTKMFEDKDRLKEVIKRNEPGRPFHKVIAIGLMLVAYVLFIVTTYFGERYIDSH